MGPAPPEVVLHEDAAALAAAVATRLAAALTQAQEARGSASVVLTGGRVGTQVLRQLAEVTSAAPGLDWSGVDVWWGDERVLPAGHPDRNETQAREALLDAVPVDPARVHPMPAGDGAASEAAVEAAAARYAEELAAAARREGVPGAVPVLDVLLLGVGPDGHVASLFPGHPATAVEDRPVTGVLGAPKPPPTRTSLTLPTITGAEQVWCVVSGADKAEAVETCLSVEGRQRGELPGSRVTGTARTLWLLDADAASRLPG